MPQLYNDWQVTKVCADMHFSENGWPYYATGFFLIAPVYYQIQI